MLRIMPLDDVNIYVIFTLSIFYCRFIGIINGIYLFIASQFISVVFPFIA